MKRRVVLAGWGQVTQRKEQRDNIKGPLGLMAEASFEAFHMADPDLIKGLDGVMVVKMLSRTYRSPAKELAQRLGASPGFTFVSRIGGNSPQSLVNKAAGMIARGELNSVLIAGAECYYVRDKGKGGGKGHLFSGLSDDYSDDDVIGSTEEEARAGMVQPIHGFPLYETALWAESGLDFNDYMDRLGKLWSCFSRVAAKHPNSWTREARSSREIKTVTEANRFIGFPYTKYMNPLITVDLGAAVLLTGEDVKGKPKKGRPVFFLGGGYAQDRQRFLIQKTDFVSSPPLKASLDKALKRSGLGKDEIECFDFYSCFPCAVAMARKMAGLSEADPRPLTLTGGLGFFGGPGNNYSLHSIATLADAISKGERDNGLVTSLGWFMHKHAAGVYSAIPKDTSLETFDLEDEKDYLAGNPPVPIIREASGKGVIETYTVIYSRDGNPSYAVIYGKTEKGDRFVARTEDGPDIFSALIKKNRVGTRVILKHLPKENINVAEPIME